MFSLTKELKVSYKKHEHNTIIKLRKNMKKINDDTEYR
jgi:hypothetical protein